MSNLIRFTPDLPSDRWSELKQDLMNTTKDLHKQIATNLIDPNSAIVIYGETLREFLMSKEEFIEKDATYFQL